MLDLSTLNFDKGAGLLTVVTQDARSGAVLMVAHADREAIERTVATGEMHYRSRSRGLWHKGATSGNVQRVVSLTADCDGDAILARVEPAGPACHTGTVSCFGDVALGADELGTLNATIGARAEAIAAALVSASESATRDAPGAPPRVEDAGGAARSPNPSNAPKPSYTQRLLGDRNLRLKKLGEEAAELVLACADGDAPRAAEEAADLVYHTLVALRPLGVTLDHVRGVLAARHR